MNPFTQKSHIESSTDVCAGKPRIAGTRIKVSHIVLLTELGESPDTIVAKYPHLSLADIYSALAYYHDSRELIDAEIQADLELEQQARAKSGPGPLERYLNDSQGGNASLSP